MRRGGIYPRRVACVGGWACAGAAETANGMWMWPTGLVLCLLCSWPGASVPLPEHIELQIY